MNPKLCRHFPYYTIRLMGLHKLHSNLAAGSKDKIPDQYPNCARINRSEFANKIKLWHPLLLSTECSKPSLILAISFFFSSHASVSLFTLNKQRNRLKQSCKCGTKNMNNPQTKKISSGSLFSSRFSFTFAFLFSIYKQEQGLYQKGLNSPHNLTRLQTF